MNDQRIKTEIIQRLKASQYDARAIPETNEKTPDIVACGNDESLLIEIKERIAPSGYCAEDSINTFGLSRQNRISGVIKESAKQLKAYNHDQAFRLLWIIADREWAEDVYEQFRSSAYGLRLVAGNREGRGILKDAYYVDNSDFYRQRNVLDGIVVGRTMAGLFLNDHSPKYPELRDSRFRRLFGRYVCDPIELERMGEALYLRGDFDRSSHREVVKQLEAQCEIEVGSITSLIAFDASIPIGAPTE
jgi:hypothetical protein